MSIYSGISLPTYTHTRTFTREWTCSASTWYAWAVKVKPLLSRQAAEGVTFIGPDTHATQTMGDKIRGKLIAKMPRSVSCPHARGLVKVRRVSYTHQHTSILPATSNDSSHVCHSVTGASALMCVFIKTRCCQLAVSSGNNRLGLFWYVAAVANSYLPWRSRNSLFLDVRVCVCVVEGPLLMRDVLKTFKALMMLLQKQSLFRGPWFNMVSGCGKIVSPNLSLAFLLLKYWG